MRFVASRTAPGAVSALAASVLLGSCSGGTEPAGVPRRVVIESGAGQTSAAGRPLATPIVVRVLGDHDRPVPNANVSVAVGRDAGGIGSTVATTGSDGRVTVDPKAGPRAGDQVVEVKVGELPTELATVHAVAGTPETIAPYVGDAQSDTVGRLLGAPLVAVVRDTFGNVVPAANVTWLLRAGDGTLSEAGTATTAQGLVQARFTLGATPRADSIEVRIATAHGPSSGYFTALALSPAVASLEVQAGGAQSTPAAALFGVAPVLRALDAAGHPVAHVTVTFSTTAGGQVDPVRATSDSSGVVRVTSWRASTRAGVDTLVATAGGTKRVVMGTVLAGAPARLLLRTPLGDTLESGRFIGPRVVLVVADSAGNIVPDTATAPRSVTVSVASGAGRIARQVTATSAGDSVTYDSLVVSGGGPHVLRFSTSGLIAASSRPIYFTVHPTALSLGQHVAIVDSGATVTPLLSVSDSIGVVVGAQVQWRSSDSTVASVDTTGRIAARHRGETLVAARSVYEASRRDSTLVVVAAPGGPIVATDLERFSLPRDTTVTLTISVDARSGAPLGSATGTLSWDPAMFTYVSNAPATGAPMLAVNDADASAGVLRFAFADANGRSGRTALLHVTLRASGPGSGALSLATAQLSAADAAVTLLTSITSSISTPMVIP